MKRLLMGILLVFVPKLVFAGWEVQSGGGGVFSSGQVMTFGTAEVKIGSVFEEPRNIPGLNFLVKKISKMAVDDRTKSLLLQAIYPRQDRQYYKLPSEELNFSLKKSLIETYSALARVPADKVALFAVTDTSRGTTALLPEFYKLQELEQAVVLLHESLWVINRRADYQQVVATELATQRYFENETSADNYFQFYLAVSDILNRPLALMMAALRFDNLNQNSLLPRALMGRMDLEKFLGAGFFNCYNKVSGKASAFSVNNSAPSDCAKGMLNDLITRSYDEPNSMSIRAMIELLGSRKLMAIRLESNGGDRVPYTYMATLDGEPEFFNDNELRVPISDRGAYKLGNLIFETFRPY